MGMHVCACAVILLRESDKKKNEQKTVQVNTATNIPLFFSTFILTKQP